jgi:biopolymer transport protein ExbB
MSTESIAGGLWFFIVKGGPIMIPIIILSIAALTIIFAKWWELWRFRARLDKLTTKLYALVQDGNVSAALQVSRRDETSLGRVFESALVHRWQERADLTRRLERLGGDVVADLESYMPALASVIGVEPMSAFWEPSSASSRRL